MICEKTAASNTSWPGAFADIHNHTTDGPPSTNDIVYAAVKKKYWQQSTYYNICHRS